jgi:hypothetical protein
MSNDAARRSAWQQIKEYGQVKRKSHAEHQKDKPSLCLAFQGPANTTISGLVRACVIDRDHWKSSHFVGGPIFGHSIHD